MAVDLKRPVNISDKSMPEPTAGGKPKGQVESLTIEQAANGGFSVQCRYKPKKTKKNDVVGYEAPETHVFEG